MPMFTLLSEFTRTRTTQRATPPSTTTSMANLDGAPLPLRHAEMEIVSSDTEPSSASGSDPAIVAIGETGLDYFRSEGDLSWQHDRFRHHIRAARELDKPLIIHTRDSATDVIRILREERAEQARGVMHCFVDDWETAQAAMDLGFFISISGIVTFKSATDLREVARRIPLDRLLVETDSPWLAPVPRRGKQNEPAYVRHTAEFLAELRDESFATLAAATSANFFSLFRSAAHASHPATP